MDKPKQSDSYSEEEATRRMNEALARALNMPPKPHKPAKKTGKQVKKRATTGA